MARKSIFNDNNKEKILEMHNLGFSNRKIAHCFGFAPQTIDYFFKKNNVKSNYRYSRNEDLLEKIDTPEKAYFLGWIASDGNLIENIYSIRLTIQDRDRGVLDLFSKMFETEKPLQFVERGKPHHKDQYRFQLNSKKLYYDLIQHGVHPNKTSTVYLPDTLPDNLFKYYLRGYFEGDGHLKPRKKGESASFSIACKSENMLKQLQDKVLQLSGLELFIKMYKTEVFYLGCGGTRKTLKLMSWIYSDFPHLSLERKYKTYQLMKEDYNNLARKPRKIFQRNLDGSLIREWESLSSAALFLGKGHGYFKDFFRRKGTSIRRVNDHLWTLA